MATTSRNRTHADCINDDKTTDLRLLFVASEIYPLAKTGGLADVCGALPRELAHMGIDVRLMMPGYTEAMDRLIAPHVVGEMHDVLPGVNVRLVNGWMPDSGLPVWLVDCPELFDRPGTLYQDPQGRDWDDNAERFAVLCHVAARVATGRTPLDWRADIVHAHDWHTGLIPLLVERAGPQRPRTVFTIHNMAFQGLFPLGNGEALGLPPQVLTAQGIEFYGQLSFLKAGIRFADKVTTVSPTYAREICTPEFGFGMEGLLQSRRADMTGILNGVDHEVWNPGADDCLSQVYSSRRPGGKQACKTDLQQRLGLHVDAAAPLAMSLSRLTGQKMADVLLDRLPRMLQRHPALQVAVHGSGERTLEHGFAALAGRFPGRLAVDIGYNEAHAHRLHAGADLLLHGARFEPCGLTQMYAMRYGTIPIVRRIGGLADSVIDAGEPSGGCSGSTGFVFDDATGDALERAVDRCLDTYATWPKAWSTLRRSAMNQDFGWPRSARQYAGVYGALRPLSVHEENVATTTSQTEGNPDRSVPRQHRAAIRRARRYVVPAGPAERSPNPGNPPRTRDPESTALT